MCPLIKFANTHFFIFMNFVMLFFSYLYFLFSVYSVHPYLFFNPDQQTMTFIGFNITKDSRSLVDQQTKVTLEENIMSKQLYDALQRNGVPLQDDFDSLTRCVSVCVCG